MLQSEVRQRGFTLTELLIALALFGVVTAALTTYLANVQGYRDVMVQMATRDAIARRLQKHVQSFKQISYSATVAGAAAGNAKLAACLDSGGGACDVTDPAKQLGFDLYLDQGASGPRRLAGPPEKPVQYDMNGKDNCTATDPGCPSWTAVATFWARCGSAASCPQASSVAVRFQVRPVKPLKDGRTLPANPPEPTYSQKPTSFATFHSVRKRLTLGQDCPPYTKQTGFDDNGRVTCKCVLGFTTTGLDANGQPVCQAGARLCGKNQVVKGIDAAGMPICRNVKQQCDWVKFAAKSARCPNGGWLEALDMGVCKAAPKTKKGAKREITCANNQGRCCWWEIP